jgi:putative ATPase
MPEAQLNLAQATIHLASAPKSNSTANAIWNAMSEVRSGGIGEVPLFLRDGHYKGAETLGHGTGYVSPHVATVQNPSAQANDYLPEALDGRHYYDKNL